MATTGGTQTAPAGNRRLLFAMAALPVGGLSIVLLNATGTPAEVAGFVGPGIGGLVPVVGEYTSARRKPLEQKVVAVMNGDVYMEPFVVVIYLVLAVQVFQRIFGMMMGLAIDLGIGRFGDAASLQVTILVAPIAVLFVSVPFAVYLGKAAGHRLAYGAWMWLALAMLLNIVLGLGITLFLLKIYLPEVQLNIGRDVVVASFLQFWLLYGAMLAGVWWARRTQQLFIMKRLFEKLPKAERDTIIAWAYHLPSVPLQPPAPPPLPQGAPPSG